MGQNVRIDQAHVQWSENLRYAVAFGVKEAANIVEAKAKDLVNLLYPPASNPGEPVRRRSGDGYRSIFSEVDTSPPDGPAAIVGTTSERLLEQGRGGFNYMAYWQLKNRPWLSMAFDESIDGALEAGLRRIRSEMA